jgi:hypothetical protein
MRKVFLATAMCLLVAIGAFAQDYTSVVVAVKADLVAHGVNISGACGALSITSEVARRIGFKLLHKGGGYRAVPLPDGTCVEGDQTSNPEGYATDYIIAPMQGYVGYDILGDGGGANIPQFAGPENAPDMVQRNINNWREPVPVGSPLPPPVVTPPTPPTPPTAGLEQQILDTLLKHEAAEATERQEAKEFRAAVDHEYKKFFLAVSKYVLPAVAALFAGRQMAK